MHYNKNKFSLVFTSFIIVFALFFGVTHAQTSSGNNASLQDLISKLQEQVKALQTQISELKTQVKSQGEELTAVKLELRFTKTIARGESGEDVKKLQEFLRSFSDVYPEGVVSGYFGPLTEIAVKRFQEKNGLEPVGVLGPKTRAILNDIGVISPRITSSGTITATPAEPFPGTGTRAISAQPAVPTRSVQQPTQISLPPTYEQTQQWSSEQIKCVFKNSATVQECYASASYGGSFACKGTETCLTDVKGYSGEKLTWKSSCGGYVYTTIDGSNEYAEFSCGVGVAEVEKLPDLTIFDIYSDVGKLSVKIGNIGADSASPLGHLYIWIDGELKWTYSFSTLADQSFMYPGGVSVIQPQILSGEHKIKATIDPNNVMSESNENNNTLEKAVTFSSSVSQTPDITPPIISNISVANTADTFAVILWNTNEGATSQIEYGLSTSYGLLSEMGITLVTDHKVGISELQAGTVYHYRVKSKDQAGNSAVSGDYSFKTTSPTIIIQPAVSLLAPTGLKPGFGTGGNVPNWAKTAESLSFSFDAASLSKVSAFRLYQKRPQDSAFNLVGEFSDPSSLTSCSSSKRTYGTWYLSPIWGSSCPNSAWSVGRTTGLQPISSYAVGDYLYYVTTVDASGTEGPRSITGKSTLLESFAIQSPTAAQSPVGLTPTFTWPVVSGWPRTPAYWIFVAPSDSTGQAIWQSALSIYGSTGSKVYDGPALDPNKKYVVWIYGHSHNSDQSEDQSSFAMGTETFLVSASTPTSTSYLDMRIKNLAAISVMFDTISSLLDNLKKLLQ